MPYPRRKPTPYRVLCYAVNGLGLGHLTRLLAISRELRRLAWLCDFPIEIVFLTTSEADSLAALHEFAAFKIPSRGVATAGGLDGPRYRKLAKQWVWNAVSLFSPDLLIVDTFPGGVFEELLDVLDFGSKNVFVYRAVRPAQAKQPHYQAALGAYDLILQPGEGGEVGNDSPVPEALQHRVVPTREILIRSRAEMLTRDLARETLGLPLDASCVYVSVGGGGDQEAEARYRILVEVAKLCPEIRFVFGAGTLYRGREWPAANISWTRRPLMATCFTAFDGAITAGGYNTVAELMHAGVPCVFLPQGRTHDDQGARVDRCIAEGVGFKPEADTPEEIAKSLQALLRPEAQRAAANAAVRLVPVNDASFAAANILSLALEPAVVEQATDLRDAYMSSGTILPDTWKESEFLRAFGLMFARSSQTDDEDEAIEAALEATYRLVRESDTQGIAPREAIVALRRGDDLVEGKKAQ